MGQFLHGWFGLRLPWALRMMRLWFSQCHTLRFWDGWRNSVFSWPENNWNWPLILSGARVPVSCLDVEWPLLISACLADGCLTAVQESTYGKAKWLYCAPALVLRLLIKLVGADGLQSFLMCGPCRSSCSRQGWNLFPTPKWQRLHFEGLKR